MTRRHATPLETVSVTVPEIGLEAYEAALNTACDTVGFFRDDRTGAWRVEGVKPVGANEPELAAALLLAELVSGVSARLERAPTEAEGWLARTYASFPEQPIGKRFVVRGTHLTGKPAAGRIMLTLDAGLAFGSGEHGSTRGCIVALEAVALRHPRRILDLGTGSGILAIAAAKLLRRKVLGSDVMRCRTASAGWCASGWRMGGTTRPSGAAPPTILCSAISWPARSVRWPRI
jgi:ribosomal protein L11 methyltransferase